MLIPSCVRSVVRTTPQSPQPTNPAQKPIPPTQPHPPTQRYRPNPVAAITEREFQLAKRILSSFDLVLITEHMKWPNQTAYARGVLWGEEGLVGGALEEATAEARGRRGLGGRGGQQMVEKMGVHNRVQVAKDDSEIDAETLRGLWDSNHWDLLLYHYAVNLVRERVAAFEKGDVVGGVGEGDGGGQCKQPVNDPEYRRDKPKEGEDPGKPHRDSYLFSAPFCETNDYGIEALDETLGFPW